MTRNRLTRLAALSLCALGVVATTPAFAGTTDTSARSGTGALTGKVLTARTTLTSTSGKKLVLSVTASSPGNTVTIGLAQGRESHLWTFKARAADISIGSTGGGTIKLSNTQTGNRGRLDLKLSPRDTFRTRKCGTQVASRTRPVAVSGIAYFKTGTAAWGNVGKATRAISLAGANTVTWSYDVSCSTPPPACARTLSWSAFRSTSAATLGLSGTSNGSTASITAFRSSTLSAPSGATRMDLVTTSAPVPTFSQTGSSATLVARLGTGSLTVQGDGGFGSSYQCRTSTGTVTATDTSWWGSTTNGTKALTVPAQVFGGFSIANGSTGSIGRQTF